MFHPLICVQRSQSTETHLILELEETLAQPNPEYDKETLLSLKKALSILNKIPTSLLKENEYKDYLITKGNLYKELGSNTLYYKSLVDLILHNHFEYFDILKQEQKELHNLANQYREQAKVLGLSLDLQSSWVLRPSHPPELTPLLFVTHPPLLLSCFIHI